VSSGGTFESVRFANKIFVGINGMSGGDTVTINNPNPAAGMTTLDIFSVQTISQTGPLIVPNFKFTSSGPVLLGNVNNDVDTLSGLVLPAGAISFADVDDLTIPMGAGGLVTLNGNLTLMTGGALTMNEQVGSDGVLSVVTLNSGGPVTQAGGVSARLAGSRLRFLGTGPFTLNNPDNFANIFAANTLGAVAFTGSNPSGMQIGNVAGTLGVDTNNHLVSITSLGSLTVTDTRPGPDVDAGTSTVSLIAGRAGQDDALTIQPNAGVSGTGGGLSMKADNMSIGAAVIAPASCCVNLQPFEQGTLINLGGADGPNTLGLTDAEMDLLMSSINGVGNNFSGTITVTSPISPANATQLNLFGAGDFSATGGGSISVNRLFLADFAAAGHNWTITPTNITASPGNPIPYVGISLLLVFTLGTGVETFNVTPSMTTAYDLFAGIATATLNMNLAGTTNPFLTITSPGEGKYTFNNRQNVTFTDIDTLLPPVDLSITNTDGLTVVQPGANVSYVIIAKNNGSLGLNPVSVSDTLPPALTNANWTCFASPGSNCGAPNGTGNINQLASLAAGGTATYTLTVTVASSASGTITNTATVAQPSGVGDPTPGNNSATDTTSIPTLSIDDVTVTEGNNGSANAVFTVTLTPSLQSTVTVDYFTANGSATEPADYTAVNGPLTFAPGQTTHNVTVPVNGDTLFEGEENFFVNLINPTGAVIGDSQGMGKITDDDASGGTLTLSASANPVPENAGKVTITITRTGNTSLPVSVDLATSDLTATQKNDYSIQLSTFTFGAGETTKSIDIFITDDVFLEGNEAFNVQLSNPTNNSVVGAPNPLTITIIDNDTMPQPNPIDEATFFVRQNYIDFLNREPDPSGLAFWVGEINSCGLDTQCIEVKRINVSAAFYLSIEFQETGAFVIRTNRAAFGKKSDVASSRLSYQQLIRDGHKVGEGVVVGVGNWQQQLEENKDAYARQVASSAQFIAQYPLAQTADQFVDALFASAMVVPTPAERQAAINAFGGGGGIGRVAALRSVADSTSVRDVEFRPSFVLLEYFGYLRRAPTDPPDADDSGYQFWLTKLNQFNGNFVQAEMVKAFIVSGEYRSRFGP
jgi:uncharacterized repeat protein (TIGR01451 family)